MGTYKNGSFFKKLPLVMLLFNYRASLKALPPTNSRKIEFLGISSLSSGIT